MTAYAVEDWGKENTPSLLVEMQTCTASLDISMMISQQWGLTARF